MKINKNKVIIPVESQNEYNIKVANFIMPDIDLNVSSKYLINNIEKYINLKEVTNE